MTIQNILEMLFKEKEWILGGFIILTSIIQISPIKLNPWSSILRWIGSTINKGTEDKIDKLSQKLTEMEQKLNKHIVESEQSDLKTRRTVILDFSSSVLRGVNYHKEKFDFMINECDAYEKYCSDNNILNGVATASINEIRRIYKEKLRNCDFLKEQDVNDAAK